VVVQSPHNDAHMIANTKNPDLYNTIVMVQEIDSCKSVSQSVNESVSHCLADTQEMLSLSLSLL